MKTPATLCSFALLSVMACAQDAADANKPERVPVQFQLLRSRKIDSGDHSLFLNRVVPPMLPAAPAAIPQDNAPISGTTLAPKLAAEKKSEVLFLTATVHDHKFSEVRWMDNEHPWTAFSNVDFNLFGDAATFETADTVYSLLLAVVNETTGGGGTSSFSAGKNEKPDRELKQIPSLEKLSPIQAQYLIVEDESGAAPQAKALAAMDALHIYFDANRQRLTDELTKREATRLEQEQRPKEPPPKPKDTVINYWIGQGATRTLDKRSLGGRP